MPELCRFFGIIITMYYADHEPPHFHAEYGDTKAVFAIDNLQIIGGKLPPRVISLVLEWAFINRAELLENWFNCRNRRPIKRIKSLE